MNEPEKLLLRPKDVMVWLGICRYELDQLVIAGVLVRCKARVSGYSYFEKAKVKQVFKLNGTSEKPCK